MPSDILDILFPSFCHVCDTRLAPHERFVCEMCLEEAARTRYHTIDPNPMQLRFAGLAPIHHATAIFFYTRGGCAATLIQDFKYRRLPLLAEKMGILAGKELFPTGYFSDVDVIMPVPIHFTKRMRRGYNQTEHLAKGLSQELQVPVSTDLRACRSHATQTRKSVIERRENTEGIFRLRHPERYARRHILLVDDVCTTGATLTSAALAIIAAQPSARISLFSLAITS